MCERTVRDSMKKRNIPFGYCYESGNICINKSEAETLARIFDCYISGKSLQRIAESLNEENVEYMPCTAGWNKARLMRIIEDERYAGSKGYPAVITKSIYEELKRLKNDRNTQKHTDRSAGIFQLNLPVICPNCGDKMKRRHDTRCKVKERWICRNDECNTLIIISDDSLLQGITEALNIAVGHPEMITAEETLHEPSNAVRRLNTEISNTLETHDFSKDDLRKKMMECVSLKYADIPSDKYISKRLKADFEKSGSLSSFHADLCKRTVKSVHITADGTVSLALINDQIIGKEQTI